MIEIKKSDEEKEEDEEEEKKQACFTPAAAHLWQTDKHVRLSSRWVLRIARHPVRVHVKSVSSPSYCTFSALVCESVCDYAVSFSV